MSERKRKPVVKGVEWNKRALKLELLRMYDVENTWEDRMGQLARAKPEKMKKMLEDWGFKVPKRWRTKC